MRDDLIVMVTLNKANEKSTRVISRRRTFQTERLANAKWRGYANFSVIMWVIIIFIQSNIIVEFFWIPSETRRDTLLHKYEKSYNISTYVYLSVIFIEY